MAHKYIKYIMEQKYIKYIMAHKYIKYNMAHKYIKYIMPHKYTKYIMAYKYIDIPGAGVSGTGNEFRRPKCTSAPAEFICTTAYKLSIGTPVNATPRSTLLT